MSLWSLCRSDSAKSPVSAFDCFSWQIKVSRNARKGRKFGVIQHHLALAAISVLVSFIMGHQGHVLTTKPEHLRRKLETKVEQVQEQFDFESRESTFNGIFEALQDDSISSVAVYGMGGVGKTTLARHVGKRVKEMNMFDLVLPVHVTTAENVKRIQGDIAAGLGLRLGEESDLAERQRQLSLRLRNEEHVLIILDDLWDKLDLQKIGILNNHCKVLLTTRSQQVAYLMGCQRSFHLFLLTLEENWDLFKRCAGIHDDRFEPDLLAIAREVSAHCEGLPLTISILGSALRARTVDLWKQVLKDLMSSRRKSLNWEDDSTNFIIQIIVVIYNIILASKEAKIIFLICGMYPEDHEILIEDLFQQVIRLRLCSKTDVIATITSLKDSSLLMPSITSKDHVLMHDLVRYAARKIIFKEKPTNRDNISEYMNALYNEEHFQWQEALHRLLCRLFGATEYPESSSSTSSELQVAQSYSSTIPRPSGKMVDFYGLCQVDKSFLPLLKEACTKNPNLIESQRKHSEMLRQSAFDSLGRLLFLLHNVRIRDWINHKQELQMYWEQAKLMKFDLEWSSPAMERVLSSADLARIEALREEEKYWNEEASKLREKLKIVEDKAAVIRTEIVLTESKLDGFAIGYGSEAGVVSKVSPWRKIFLFR
ncbi:hypothetical protein Ahy_A07g031350 [Arachis hypogaea]|uniref:NB-ARC domain-containing protein n=1 Tax=Arachis hypogaea TaxID=3818 RepID=A0A445C3L1_ARAHY|nr:hypothetical protein Ahy_A07g031350 [Arachis hypogaea]